MAQNKHPSSSSHGLTKLSGCFSRLSRVRKRELMLALDVLCIPFAIICAYLLDMGHLPDPSTLFLLSSVAIVCTVPVFVRLGLYRAVIRYIGSQSVRIILIGVTISLAFQAAISFFVPSLRMPLPLLTVYWLIAVSYVIGSRFVARGILQQSRMSTAEPILVYGAGAAGTALVWSLSRVGSYLPVAFVDDDISLRGANIAGLDVFPPSQLRALIDKHSIQTILLAMPSVSHRRKNEIIRLLEAMRVRVQTVPDLSEIVSGKVVINDFRDVDADDLLGRDPVLPKAELMSRCVTGKVVLVTGAGGSIGSELCRQIVKLKPACLILLDVSEAALFTIDRELGQLVEQAKLKLDIVPLIGNAQHLERMKLIMCTFQVQSVYHAAAYKHVPLVERNIVRGLQNNVLSTWLVAEAAIAAKVEVFVLISTDKAVNPTNVMGATKRMAEMVLQGMHQRGVATRFCMVRFGNVLESSGSVVPLFREQIKNGGPVTVTHRDIIRYFMTIPEAVQLVIQAGSMANGGDVFVLDMGEPVRILDLAKRMVKLMGFSVRDEHNPQGEIEIAFTGLRPGEKLYEELLIGSNVIGTEHPMIMRANEHFLAWPIMKAHLDRLQCIIERFDSEDARRLLIDCVAEYQPDPVIHDLVYVRQKAALQTAKITELRVSR